MTPLEELDRRVAAFEGRPIQRRLTRAAGEISPDTVDETWYLHTVLCQAYLPASRPGSAVRVWERRNGDVTVRLEAGSAYIPDEHGFFPLPLPYGAKARLALIALTSEAVCTASPEIDVGRSMTAFLAELLQRSPAGRDIKQFRQQMASLIVATMRIGWCRGGTPVQVSTPIAEIVEGLDPGAWAATASRRGRWPWPKLRLSETFFHALEGHAVPLDRRALASLSHSALGLDLYCWLAQRLHRIDPARPAFIPWPHIHRQFGGFSRLRDFRPHLLSVLSAVKAVYQAANVTEEHGPHGQPAGLRLRHSPPPVLRTAVLVHNHGGDG